MVNLPWINQRSISSSELRNIKAWSIVNRQNSSNEAAASAAAVWALSREMPCLWQRLPRLWGLPSFTLLTISSVSIIALGFGGNRPILRNSFSSSGMSNFLILWPTTTEFSIRRCISSAWCRKSCSPFTSLSKIPWTPLAPGGIGLRGFTESHSAQYLP